MSRLLRIDTSVREQGSHSREIADYFQNQWLKYHPDDEVVLRDLVRDPLPHIQEATINGFYTPETELDATLMEATRLSDQLIGELMASDILLISTPMYNFSIPSSLKAWIDQVVRIGRTFAFNPEKGFQGLVRNKQAIIVTASGAVFSNETMSAMNFLEPYLRTLLSFLGITKIDFLAIEGTTMDDATTRRSKELAREKVDLIVQNMTPTKGDTV